MFLFAKKEERCASNLNIYFSSAICSRERGNEREWTCVTVKSVKRIRCTREQKRSREFRDKRNVDARESIKRKQIQKTKKNEGRGNDIKISVIGPIKTSRSSEGVVCRKPRLQFPTRFSNIVEIIMTNENRYRQSVARQSILVAVESNVDRGSTPQIVRWERSLYPRRTVTSLSFSSTFESHFLPRERRHQKMKKKSEK